MIIPFDLSLVEVPAGQPTYVAPLAAPTPEGSRSDGSSIPEQPTSSTAQPSQRSDAQIEIDVVQALDSSKALKNEQIIAVVVQKQVTLTGRVSNEAASELAEWTVSHVLGVATVNNELQLRQVDRNIPQ